MTTWFRKKRPAVFDQENPEHESIVDEESKINAEIADRRAEEAAGTSRLPTDERREPPSHVQVVEPRDTPSPTPAPDVATADSLPRNPTTTQDRGSQTQTDAEMSTGGDVGAPPSPPTGNLVEGRAPRVSLALPTTKDAGGSSYGHRASNAVEGVVVPPAIGGGSKFGANDWWDVSPNKRWWKLTPSGLSSDVMCDAGSVGDLAVVAGTVRGWKHQIAGSQNEDSFFVGSAENLAGKKYAVAVLSDGLSSATHSGYSARRVTQVVGRRLSGALAQASNFDKSWFDSALTAILESTAALVTRVDPDDYGAPVGVDDVLGARDVLVTLTVLVIEAELSETRQRNAIAGFIGDSPVFVLSDGVWSRKSAGDDDVMVENRTRAFPMDTSCESVEFTVSMGDAVVITSDGVGNFIGTGDKTLALGAFLREQWSRPVSVLTFLNHLSFDLKSADDDRTAIAVWSAVEESVTP